MLLHNSNTGELLAAVSTFDPNSKIENNLLVEAIADHREFAHVHWGRSLENGDAQSRQSRPQRHAAMTRY